MNAVNPASDCVMIVDDSLTVRMDLSDAFEAAGFRVLCCDSLAQARTALRQEPVGLMVLDVLLPDGDGMDLLKEVRANPALSTMQVLVLSSEADVKDRIRGLQTGANEYVGKPYDVGHVVARAKRFLRGRQSTADDRSALVLVIDDSLTFRERMVQALQEAGYQTLSAASGEQGLALAADRRPDAVIVDGMLPGIDGPTVIRHLRLDGALRGCACLLLTASEDSEAELRALDAGADAFVHKTGDLEIILARLAATLRRMADMGSGTPSLLGPKTILAVDDSPTFLNELADTLRGDGFDVVLARSGEEALSLLAIQLVDCILLDLVMPGLNGQETCRRIKSAPVVRDIPLIMLTAQDERAAMLDSLSAGADDYIAKSSEFSVLRARLRAQLRRKQFEDENRRIREKLLRTELEMSRARAAEELAAARAVLVDELERKNRELEAFSYSVSHDLRTPLRSLAGFSHMLTRDYRELLDARGQEYLNRVALAAQRMGELIDALLLLSRISSSEIQARPVNLTHLAERIAADLQQGDPERAHVFDIEPDLHDEADDRLVAIVLENLLGNAWKFTAKTAQARIHFGRTGQPHQYVYAVRDNGAGFDMAHQNKLFQPFQRLHSHTEFAGTGIGLATVQRIVERHGGTVRAEGQPGQGASFYFTLGKPAR